MVTQRSSGRFLLILYFVAVSASPRALANSRQPSIIFVRGAPGNALGGSRTDAKDLLVVEKEDLQFDCQLAVCEVTARYEILAKRTLELAFSFVVPSAVRVSAEVGGRETAWNVRAKRQPAEITGGFEAAAPSFAADFTGTLPEGASSLVVKYTQPLTLTDHCPGYFCSHTWSYSFDYYLWPLKEWTLGEHFKLNIVVRRPLPERGALARAFGLREPEAHCYYSITHHDESACAAFKNSPQMEYPDVLETSTPGEPFMSEAMLTESTNIESHGRGETQVHRAQFGSCFPDALVCWRVGDPEADLGDDFIKEFQSAQHRAEVP